VKIRLQPILVFALLGVPVFAQDTRFARGEQQLGVPACWAVDDDRAPRPCPPEEHQMWLRDIRHWRDERRIRTGYDGARYDLGELKWTQTSFIQPQMMVQDRYFYDPVARKYTVDRYLEDLRSRYGGIDAVLVWPTYPNLGIDNRNQHDMIRCMPGGIQGVKQMIADFHRRGVRVLFPMMMWDQGTRDPSGSWPKEIAKLMAEIDADGINGDTQDGVPLAFTTASEELKHPLAFEPEHGPSDEAIAWNVMTWGQYQYPFVPLVDKYKWLEPHHMVNISDRWNRDKTDNLQFAFFNGVGWESWENIWGIWNGITPRDAEAARRVATMERSVAPFLASYNWEPMAPTLRFGIFASRWTLKDQSIWTIVNRNEFDVDGPQLEVSADKDMRYFDLYRGTELRVQRNSVGRNLLSFAVEAHGYGAILATRISPNAGLQALMAEMKQITLRPLSSYSHEWKALPQQIVPIAATPPTDTLPENMIKIPESDYLFEVGGIEIEGSNDIGVDVQYPWEDAPRRFHMRSMHIKSFFIDTFPITNAQFKNFLDATHYHPQDDLNFLRDWKDGTFPAGWDDRPVTWVSLEDARAYASWAGKRLPHEWEWQYAAQGTDQRLYPWGNNWDASAIPIPDKSRTMRGPDPVDKHPKGVSPFGVMDMVGNVWQWTDEFTDDHTRAGILRGGSYYQPQGSKWYFPQAYRNDEHGKLLLMAPSYDRSGAVGFRCVKDGP
jgi:gamma-glutamyl hercynylcysteine S-oxide synthase